MKKLTKIEIETNSGYTVSAEMESGDDVVTVDGLYNLDGEELTISDCAELADFFRALEDTMASE